MGSPTCLGSRVFRLLLPGFTGHFPLNLAEALLENIIRWSSNENPFHCFLVKYGTLKLGNFITKE